MIPSASGYLHTRINYDVLTYLPSDIETNEPAKIAKIYVTVYYAEKGEQMLHHFKKSMDIGNGHGGIEINKRIIQEKQGKDKTERGVDLGVRTV